MTLDEARQHLGEPVVYRLGEVDDGGFISSVNDKYVFVLYGASKQPQATRAEYLTLATEIPEG